MIDNEQQAAAWGELHTLIPPTGSHTGGVPLLRLHDVSKMYESAAGGFPALKGVSLDIYPGEFLGIVGKSGAGKTTFLNMIAGVSEISDGQVLFQVPANGEGEIPTKSYPIHAMSENEIAMWRGSNVGIVYQSFELLPMLDLIDNVMIPQDFTGRYISKMSRQRALELLELVGLEAHAYKLPTQISGGQKQRVAIARALVNDPLLILADEPTGNLDTVTAETIFQIFEGLVARGKTVVMVTHDQDLARRFSRRLSIVDGRIVSDTSKEKFDQVSPSEDEPNSQTIIEMTSRSEHDGQTITEEQSNGAQEAPNAASSIYDGLSQVQSDRSKPAIVLRNVVKTYVSDAGSFTALNGIDLQLNFGQFVSIVGKSGSGKSTLLNMITGIDHPTAGDVLVDNNEIYGLTESQRALWRGKGIGIVFQFFQLLPMLTLLENTMLPMDYTNTFPAAEREQRAKQLLAMVGLEDHVDKLPAAVSSGQQQSAAIARALATDPPIVVADEPTGNLDSRSADMIIRLFEELAAKGKTIVIVTHDSSLTKRTDQTVIISDGEIIDKTIAKVLPLLDHPQLLEATRTAEKRTYQPGTTIVSQGQEVDEFYMVVDGEVDIVLSTDVSREMNLARLGNGQFFGDVELLRGGGSIASARAGDMPVEVAVLSKDMFDTLLSTSQSMRKIIDKKALRHMRENLAHREEGDHDSL